jgi:hypothetical protein
MVNVDSTGVLHAARQKGISDGAEEHDGKNDEILTKRQSNIPVRVKSKQTVTVAQVRSSPVRGSGPIWARMYWNWLLRQDGLS